MTHTLEAERALTAWMGAHLFVTAVGHPNPKVVEAEVLALLGPPLNHQHNSAHPNFLRLDARRAAWRDLR